MIFTASVIDGFKVILGSMPLQFAMLLTVLTLVPVPEDPTEPGVKDPDARFTYWWLVFVHGIFFAQILVNHYFALDIPMISSVSNVVLMLAQVMTQINLSVNWIFYVHPDQTWADARSTEDWIKFRQWCYIELLAFVGYLVSAIIFNFLRCF